MSKVIDIDLTKPEHMLYRQIGRVRPTQGPVTTITLEPIDLKVSAGGPGSGCHGPNCGRPRSGRFETHGWKVTRSGNTTTLEHPEKGKSVVYGADKVDRTQYHLNASQKAAEAKFASAIAHDPEKMLAEYRSKFGNELNADNAKELSPDYRKDRTSNAIAVHEPASWLVRQLYARMLKEEPTGDKDNLVFFTAGGAGAGKSSGVKASPTVQNIADHAQIVYDGTLRPASSAIEKIEQALAAGKKVMVAYTDRDPEEAFKNGVIPRALKSAEEGGGRTVPIEEFARQHTSVRDSMNTIAEKYKDNPNFAIAAFDNSGGKGGAKQVELNDLPAQKHTFDTLVPALKEHLKGLYESNQISKKLYQATLGGSVKKEIGM